MTKHIDTSTDFSRRDFSRRDFFGAAAGLTLALTIAPDPLALLGEGAGGEALADGPLSPNVWVTIATDGTITIVSPAAEMGQGTFTTLPAVIAEELDADWAKVKPVFPPEWTEKKYGNPGSNYVFQTSASFATRGYFKSMRLAGAQARRVLIDAVAAKWGVPAAELSTGPSVVVHTASNRRISYGEIAAFAKAPAELPKIDEKDLKPAATFRFIGKDVPRVELPLKVTGAAKYAIDAQVPGMVYAAVLQSPYPGGKPEAVDETRARQVAGITDIVKLPEGVGVVGTSVEATQAAKNLLKVTWSDAPGARLDSERALDEFAAIGRDKSRAGVPYEAVGDAKTAMRSAAKVYRGEYRTRYIYHAQMEPVNATASVSADGKSVEIWTGTQGPTSLHDQVARLLGTERTNITLHQHFLGGGYGRREVILDAVRLAKAVGKPVKLIWTREDDLTGGKFRPMTAHHVEAGFDAAGKLVAWHHRVVAESVAAYTSGAPGGDRRLGLAARVGGSVWRRRCGRVAARSGGGSVPVPGVVPPSAVLGAARRSSGAAAVHGVGFAGGICGARGDVGGPPSRAEGCQSDRAAGSWVRRYQTSRLPPSQVRTRSRPEYPVAPPSASRSLLPGRAFCRLGCVQWMQIDFQNAPAPVRRASQ
jgi:isoquinoline 1-oxidoreductase subunit beta